MMVTECSMSDNIQVENQTEFIRPCNMCPYRKKLLYQNTRRLKMKLVK